MKDTKRAPFSLKAKFSAMLFQHFMLFPVWALTLYTYVDAIKPNGHEWAVWCGMVVGISTFTTPLMCMLADRFFRADRLFTVLNLFCAIFMAAAFFTRNPAIIFALSLATMICYMPMHSLTASISLAHLSEVEYTRIRVFVPLGWVSAAIFSFIGTKCFHIENFDVSHWIFAAAALVALWGVVIGLFLPATLPQAKGTPMNVADLFGLRSLSLLRNPMFALFILLLVATMVPFEWYFQYNSKFLEECGFQYIVATSNCGQVAEIGFTMLVPLILARFGYKWTIVTGIAALTLRYAFFTGSTLGCSNLLYGGILIHGLIYSTIFMGAQIYLNNVAPPAMRNQAQGLFVLVEGVGECVSVYFFEQVLRRVEIRDAAGVITGHAWFTPFAIAFGMALVITILMALCFHPEKAAQRVE